MLLEGGVSKYGMPLLLNNFGPKSLFTNAIAKMLPFRNILPDNIKWLHDGFSGNNRIHTNKDLSSSTLNALRLAYDDSQKTNPGSITYNNYPMYTRNGYWLPQSYEDTVNGLFNNTINSPGYVASSTLGNVNNISRDKNGHVILKDRYNFDNASKEDYMYMNPVYRTLHKMAEQYAKPYNVEIDLGNPNKGWSYD